MKCPKATHKTYTMKNIVAIVVLLMVTSVAFGQGGKKGVTVPPVVEQAFKKQYPGEKAKWSSPASNQYMAVFKKGGKKTWVYYDAYGKETSTSKEIKVSELPADAANYLKANNGKVKTAVMFTSATGSIVYTAGGHKFDSGGKLIK